MNDVPDTPSAPLRDSTSEEIGQAEVPRLFGRCTWFRALASEHQTLVLEHAQAEYRETGALVARRQAPSDYWIGVHSGLLKLALYTPSGRSCTFSGVPPGGWFGEGSVIKRELRKYDVVAIRPSVVLLVPSATFHTLLSSSLPFNGFVIRQLNNRMGEFIASIQNSRLLDVDARVAQSLAQLFNPDLYPETGRTLAISQEEIGLLAGVSRQRSNQALQNLERLGIVRVSRNQIDVLDVHRLSAFGRDQI
ncbi:Crp/Fnr family transcriptional regulator [Trinickia sp. EG282A]|uniref:Crp/Fnr family transcriptional regulator n=1 Tax=Trinickia sp. EG282A TaxID=3237013 RepID=UPI0034D2639A